ncbi:MAG: helix-turn-helix transcriptional regulator [Flavobacteriales bacterium]
MDKREFTTKLGDQIRKLREQNGLSQSELARRCDKDRQHIELIENGKTTCTSYTLYVISKAIDTDLNNLFDI